MSIGLILISIFVGVPAIIFGSAFISIWFEERGRKAAEKREHQAHYERLYEHILQCRFHDTVTGDQGEVKELPQLTFDKFLTFYNTNPMNWDIDLCTTNIGKDRRLNCYVPTYYKKSKHTDKKGKTLVTTTSIPIFWSSPEELSKFEEWTKTEYKKGNAAGYQWARDERTIKLAQMLQEDVKERQQKIDEQYKRTVESINVPVPGTNVNLTLQTSSGDDPDVTLFSNPRNKDGSIQMSPPK